MYRGSCLCGKVKVKVLGKIESIIHCHCSLCRKSTGSAYATNGFVDKQHFVIEQGVEHMGGFEFRPGKVRHFCKVCVSPVYSSNEADKNRIRLRLGILGDDIEERPISHNFITSKANWDDPDVELPHYEGHEPDR